MASPLCVGAKFASQEAFNEAKNQYERHQQVPYVIENNTLATTWNQKRLPGQAKVPAGFLWKTAHITCKHYGEPKLHQHKEGKARRPNQSTFKRDCRAKFIVNYSFIENAYVITKLEDKHSNHVRDATLASHYPEFKRPSSEIVEKTNQLFEYEAKTHRIRDMVLSSGVKASAQDIQNLRNKWNASHKGKKKPDSPEAALFDQLHDMKVSDPGSNVAILYDEDTYEITSVFFQTSEMCKALKEFPEVIITDTTYKLCDNDMPLIVYDVVDCYGAGRSAGYALISSEKKEIVTASLELLKNGCPEIVDKVHVVVIDKDTSEIASVKTILPNAAIHLCDYHVKEIFKRRDVRQLSHKWEELTPILSKMIHAFSEADYKEAYQSLVALAGEGSPFMAYFNKNWHNSELVWTEYRRNLSFSLNERTTGRVECKNAKIKGIVSKKQPAHWVIRDLRTLHKLTLNEIELKDFRSALKTTYHKYSNDPVIQQILKINTPFVGDLLKRQYERSLQPASHNQHVVSNEKCDCAFFVKFRLTCSHIFRERKRNGAEIYDHSLTPARWTVVLPDSGCSTPTVNIDNPSCMEVLRRSHNGLIAHRS